jgi:hypothetical protein
MTSGSSTSSHGGPEIRVPARPAGSHAATAISPAPATAIPASVIMAGSLPGKRRTACTPRT